MMTDTDNAAASAAPEATQAPAPIQTPAPEGEDSSSSTGNGIADIADLLGLSAEPPKSDETPKDGQPPSPPQDKPEEKQAAPVPAPGKEGLKPEEAPKPPEGEKDLKTLLKEVIAETKPKEEGEQKPKPAEAEKPFYQPVIPQELMAAVEHENPQVRHQAMNAIIGGAMNKVRSDLIAHFKGELQSFAQQVPQTVQAQQEARQKAVTEANTFYEENPNFGKSPKMKQLVSMMGLQLAQSMGKEYKGMDTAFRQKLAAAFSEATGIAAGKPQAQVPPKDTKPARGNPPLITGGSPTRAGDHVPSLSDEIMDIVTLN